MFDLIPKDTKIGQVVSPEARSSLEYCEKKLLSYCSKKIETEDATPKNLRGLVLNLRHSVAHFLVEPTQADEITGYKFRNDGVDFKIELKIEDIQKVVESIAHEISQQKP